MEDKPTLKEYLRSRNTRYVETADGRYYVITNYSFTLTLTIILTLLLAAPSFTMPFSCFPWRGSISCDFFILLFMFSLPIPRLVYQFEKFELLQEGSEKYKKASGKEYWGRNLTIIGMALLMLTYSMSSFTLSYLRSLKDTPEARISIKWAQEERQTVDTEEGGSIIMMPAEMGETVEISLSIYHTPYAPELMIDGENVDYEFYGSRSSTRAFSKYYFQQYLDFAIPAADIHNGSLLMLTCGKWSYEWTFLSGAP